MIFKVNNFIDALVLIVTNVFILYFTIYGALNIWFFIVFLLDFMRMKPWDQEIENSPEVTILVPAFNEEKVIVHTVSSLLNLEYPRFSIIVIDDGSTDRTSKNLVEAFGMSEFELKGENGIRTSRIISTYRAKEHENLYLIRKENGGKADALNVGLNYSKGQIVITIDADTILSPRSLLRLINLFKEKNAAAVGGLLTVSNDAVIKDGRPLNARFPRNLLVVFQLIEYLVSYSIGRSALSRIDSLLVLSGAFSAFDRSLLIKVGGFLSKISHGKSTVCEDMEIIVRLHRFLKSEGINRPIKFHFFPIAWTEVPSNLRNIVRQRNRWHRGLGESLFIHFDMLFNPLYKHIGLFAVPYYLIFEFLSPIVKLLSLFLIFILILMNLIHWQFVITLFLLVTVLNGLYTSLVTTLVEMKFRNISRDNIDAMRFKTLGDWFKLVVLSFFLEPIFGVIRNYAQLWGILDLIRGKVSWYKFEREGINVEQ